MREGEGSCVYDNNERERVNKREEGRGKEGKPCDVATQQTHTQDREVVCERKRRRKKKTEKQKKEERLEPRLNLRKRKEKMRYTMSPHITSHHITPIFQLS